jgi:hypothetical protein
MSLFLKLFGQKLFNTPKEESQCKRIAERITPDLDQQNCLHGYLSYYRFVYKTKKITPNEILEMYRNCQITSPPVESILLTPYDIVMRDQWM